MTKLFKAIIFVAVTACFVTFLLIKSSFHLPESVRLPTTQTTKHASFVSPPLSSLDHIVIITMENKAYNDVVGNLHAPYINALLNQYSFADNYSAVSHPSLPNYLALIGGDTFGITSDCTECYQAAPNLVDQLEQSHKSWKAYMEDMPTPCFLGSTSLYAKKHNPFIYFDDIRTNPNRCRNIVPYSQLQADLRATNTTPNFMWISPNICHDMHDCSVETGDTWLSQQIPQILESPAFTRQKSLLVITWDEGEGSGDNHIPTILVGSTVKKAYISHPAYTHYSLLHTIENLWNLPALTPTVSRSAIISDIFSST